jgi:thiamine transport system ATP-binding protein
MLEVEKLRFRWEDMAMCFDLTVPTGECLAVVGPSGAGKSTLLELIAGFTTPLSGAVRVDGRDITRLPPARRPLTTVFQEHNVFPHLDLRANVGLGIHPGLKLGHEDRQRIDGALQRVGLAGMEKRLPGQLSGGQRQRVALARALVRRQSLLLLDEPFAALGPALRHEMLGLIQDLQQSEKLTVVLVSHHPDDARRIARYTAFVDEGEVRALGLTAEILSREDLPMLRAYLGSNP